MKAYFRDETLNNKDKFNKTNDNQHIINAAITYGTYKGLGGLMLIPLPPFLDDVVDVITPIVLAKSKAVNNDSSCKLEKIMKCVSKTLTEIKSYSVSHNDSKFKLEVYLGEHTIPNTYEENSIDEILARLANACIEYRTDLDTDKYKIYNKILESINLVRRV